MSTLTDNTPTIPQLRDQLEARLLTSTGAAWTVKQYAGTTARGLGELLNTMSATDLPAAIIAWQNEVAHQTPGRPQRTYNNFHVLLLAADAQDQGGADVVQAMLDAVKERMDNHTGEFNTVWHYMGAEAIDLSAEDEAPNLSCIDATLEVGTH